MPTQVLAADRRGRSKYCGHNMPRYSAIYMPDKRHPTSTEVAESEPASALVAETELDIQQPSLQIHGLLASGCVLGLATLCYANSCGGGFVFDDNEAIVNNKDVVGDGPLSLLLENNFWGERMGSAWSRHQSFRPITTATFRLNYQLHGLETFQYHTVNVAVNGLACVLFERMARELLRGHSQRDPVALAAALLWAAHPVRTEAVAGLVGRAELLSAMFFMLSFCPGPPGRLSDLSVFRCK